MASNIDVGSILLKLQDLKTNEYFGGEAGLHIDAVADCIRELYENTARLKSDHEAATIKSGVLRHRLADMTTGVPAELSEAVGKARTLNQNYMRELKNQTDDLRKKIENAEEEEQKLKHENEKLFVRAEAAREIWPKMTNIIGSALRKKSVAQLSVNDTRCKTVDAHERSITLAKDAEEMCQDVEDYWNYCYVQMSKINTEADKWKTKIAEQDLRTQEAKAIFEEVETQVKDSRSLLNAQEQITNNLIAIADTAREKKEKKKRILKNKKKRYQEAIEERELFHKSLADNKEAMKSIRQKEKNIEDEINKNGVERRKLTDKVQKMKESLNEKRKEAKEKMENRKMQKTIMVESNNLIGTVLEDAAFGRAERERLKKRIAAVIEDRDLTRKSYAREFEKLNEFLDKESASRQDVEKQYEASLEELEREEREQNQFITENKTIIQSFVAKKEILERTKKQTKQDQKEFKSRKAQLLEDINTNNRYYEITIVELKNEIEQSKIRVENMKESIVELREEKKKMEPKFLKTEEEFKHAKVDHDAVRDKTVELNRKYKDMCEEGERSVIETVTLEKAKGELQQKLAHVNKEVINEIESLKEIKSLNVELHTDMKRHEKLHKENAIFVQSCKKLKAQIQDEKTRIDNTEEYLQQLEVHQQEIEQKLVRAIAEEMELTDLARERDLELIDGLVAKKEFSNNRRRILDGVTTKMRGVLESIEKLQSEEGIESTRKKK